MTPLSLLGCAALCLAGVLFSGWLALSAAGDAAVLDQRGVSAPGTVVGVEHKSTPNGTGGYINWTAVTVTFTDTRRARVRASHEGSSDTQVGDRFQVVYDPAHPSNIRWDTSTDEAGLNWAYAAVYLGGSLLCVAGALWKVVRRHRATRGPGAGLTRLSVWGTPTGHPPTEIISTRDQGRCRLSRTGP
jgi:hypothetical protein